MVQNITACPEMIGKQTPPSELFPCVRGANITASKVQSAVTCVEGIQYLSGEYCLYRYKDRRGGNDENGSHGLIRNKQLCVSTRERTAAAPEQLSKKTREESLTISIKKMRDNTRSQDQRVIPLSLEN